MSVTSVPGMAAPAHASRCAPSPKKIAAITVGNGLEFFDFTIYAFFASAIGKQFFPGESDLARLMLSLAVFGVGFVMRPIGGVVIGMYADRAGRKPAMMLTPGLMALGSAVFGGFAQLNETWLIRHAGSHLAPGWYLIGCGLPSVVAVAFARETSGRPLA